VHQSTAVSSLLSTVKYCISCHKKEVLFVLEELEEKGLQQNITAATKERALPLQGVSAIDRGSNRAVFCLDIPSRCPQIGFVLRQEYDPSAANTKFLLICLLTRTNGNCLLSITE
jgi:hypothetical protein